MTKSITRLVRRSVLPLRRILKHVVFGAIAAAWLAIFPSPSFAATSCAFTTVASVNFGAYEVSSPLTNNNGVGSFTIRCQGGGNPSLIVKLNPGQSHSFASRVMTSGANSLNYNLYTSAARTVVWGDGSGGSSVMAISRNQTTTLSIFGQIPAGQDVAIGIYTDTLIATVEF